MQEVGVAYMIFSNEPRITLGYFYIAVTKLCGQIPEDLKAKELILEGGPQTLTLHFFQTEYPTSYPVSVSFLKP